ncbi:MAG: hypothetical protein ACP5NV_04060 [Candidatus Woesearchaeota archaeon]
MKDILVELLSNINSLKKIVKQSTHTKKDRANMEKISNEIRMYVLMLGDERVEKLNNIKNTLTSNHKNLEFDIHIEQKNAQMRIDKVEGWAIKSHINQAIVTVTENNQVLIQPAPEINHKIEETLIQSIESIFGKRPVYPTDPKIY